MPELSQHIALHCEPMRSCGTHPLHLARPPYNRCPCRDLRTSGALTFILATLLRLSKSSPDACRKKDDPMPRPIWTGSIAFGLVNISVDMHTAVRGSRPRFRLLHAKDRAPINLERVCQKEGKAVAWDDLVKGYEYEKGRFVVVTKEDLAAAALEKSRKIDILDFVEANAIDNRFFDRPYYLTPGKGADASYALLREAIRQSGRIGVAKFILRNVQHLAAVEAICDALALSTFRFPDELVDVKATRSRVSRGYEAGARHGNIARRAPGS